MAFYEKARYDGVVRQWSMSGGQSFSTTITTTQSGIEQRQGNWAFSRGQWEIGNRGVNHKDLQNLVSFFHIMKGRLHGFRLRDWLDYKDDGIGVLGTGQGNNSLSYQMNKKRSYEYIDDYYLQKITKPVGKSFSGDPKLGNTIKIYWNGTEVFQGSGAGSCSVDDTTGIVTFTPFSYVASTTWVAESNALKFTSTNPNIVKVGDTITTANSQLQNLIVTQVIDNLNFLAGNVNLELPSISFQIIPGVNDELKWTGVFDKPARFDTDSFELQDAMFLEKNDDMPDVAAMLPSINIVELKL